MKRISKKWALIACIVITSLVMVLEFIVSAIANSLMLYSDALHMLGHNFALVISFIAILIAEKRGNHKVEYVAALVNGLSLLFFVAYILIDGIKHLIDPSSILAMETMMVALVGLAVNLLTALILFKSGLEDLNTKSTFLHLLADTFSSVAVIGGSIIIYYTNFFIIDALLSIVVAVVIAKWSLGLIRHSIKVLSKPVVLSAP